MSSEERQTSRVDVWVAIRESKKMRSMPRCARLINAQWKDRIDGLENLLACCILNT